MSPKLFPYISGINTLLLENIELRCPPVFQYSRFLHRYSDLRPHSCSELNLGNNIPTPLYDLGSSDPENARLPQADEQLKGTETNPWSINKIPPYPIEVYFVSTY